MGKLFNRIVDAMEENGTIDSEDKEVYLYALNTICVYAINITISVIIGFLMGMLGYCIIFLCAFIILRQDAGGYHAPGWKSCYFLSSVILIAALSWIKMQFFLQLPITVVMAALSAVCIFIYAPLADENKPLDDTDKKAVRKRAQIIVIIEFLAGLLLATVNEKLAYAILSSVILCGITYIAWFVKKKHNVVKRL